MDGIVIDLSRELVPIYLSFFSTIAASGIAVTLATRFTPALGGRYRSSTTTRRRLLAVDS
jgi:hypothetical protein